MNSLPSWDTAIAGMCRIFVPTFLIVALVAAFSGCSGGGRSSVTPHGTVHAGNSSVAVSPAQVRADGVDAATVTVTLRDENDALCPNVEVSIEAAGPVGPGVNNVSPTLATTDTDGVAIFTVTSLVPEIKTITATTNTAAGAVVLDDTPTVEFVACPVSALLSFVDANPSTSVLADGVDSSTVTVTVLNQTGLPVANESVQIDVSGSNNVLTPPGPYVSDANGVVTATLTSTTAETKTVTATTDPGGVCETTLNDTASVTFCQYNALTSTVVANPNTVLANDVDTSTITVQVFDLAGNPAAGTPVQIGVSGANNTLDPIGGLVTTGANGVATATVRSQTAELKTVSATIDPGGPCETAINATDTILFTPTCIDPTPPRSTVTANPVLGVLANGVDASTVTVVVRDIFGNAIPNVEVTLGATGSNNTFTPAGVLLTDGSGTVTSALTSTNAEAKIVSASVFWQGAPPPCAQGPMILIQTAMVSFVADPSTATATLTATPDAVPTGGNSNLTVLVQDFFLNPIAGATVTSIVSSGGDVIVINPPPATDPSGVLTATFTATAVPGPRTLTASVSVTCPACVTNPLNLTATETIAVGPTPPLSCVLTATPTTVRAGQPIAVTVTVTDSGSNPVSGAQINFSATGTGNSFTPPSPLITDALGQASTTYSSTVAEMKTITVNATLGPFGCSGAANVTITPECVDPTPPASTITANPATGLLADGSDSSSITVLVRDQFQNPIQGSTVTLSVTGTGNTLTGAAGTTDANGISQAVLSSTVAEIKTVTATVTNVDPNCTPLTVTLTGTATVEFITQQPPLHRCSETAGAVGGNKDSGEASISGDGRFVAFSSEASNLVAGDNNAEEDIFVCDRLTGALERASLDSNGNELSEDSENPSISSDGNCVAWEFDNHTESGSSPENIQLRDRTAGTTERIDVDSNGVASDRRSREPSVSGNGEFVAFTSRGRNLVSGDNNHHDDIFVRDRIAGTTTRVSVSSSGSEGSNHSRHPSISASGRFVAFSSKASNLVAGDSNGKEDVFVHDRQTGVTTNVSVDSSGAQANHHSFEPSISADGMWVVFRSQASNLAPGGGNGKRHIFLHSRATGATTRITVSLSGGLANHHSENPSVSGDGTRIAFESKASNLVSNDTNGEDDIFVHDTVTGTTTRVSIPASAVQGNDDSEDPAISADGVWVAFTSEADNLIANDNNDRDDVFIGPVQ